MHFTDIYILIWMSALSIALGVVSWDKSIVVSCYKICKINAGIIWKFLTFITTTIILSAIAPIANDPTWDIPETIIMCTLTFMTAPWSVGVIYRAIIGYEKNWKEIYIATVLWLFSSSWSYDLYVWIWQWTYPVSWSWNLMISPILYLCAGMFWNLEWREWKWVIFAFREKQWFLDSLPQGQFWKLFPYMLPFLVLGVAIFGGFLYVNM